MSFAVVKDAQGETTGAMAVARDATQRYLEEKEMRRLLAAMPQKTPEK
jgi:signal transduction histidine kinase